MIYKGPAFIFGGSPSLKQAGACTAALEKQGIGSLQLKY